MKDMIWFLCKILNWFNLLSKEYDLSLSIVENVVFLDISTENERSNGRKFDQNVDGWSRGILEWISDSVTNN